MRLGIEFYPEAEREVEAAFAWYEAERAGLGLRFVAALEAATRNIELMPEAYPRLGRRTRRAQLRRFPWFVLFVVESDRVLVTACFHMRRAPGAWQDRISEPVPSYVAPSRAAAAFATGVIALAVG